jgi:hypothetical protein
MPSHGRRSARRPGRLPEITSHYHLSDAEYRIVEAIVATMKFARSARRDGLRKAA